MKVLTIVFGIQIQKRTRQDAQLEEITYTNCLEQREMPMNMKLISLQRIPFWHILFI